jgi:hypothetical protein
MGEIHQGRFEKYTDEELGGLLDHYYEVGAPQEVLDALETELDRREVEEDDPSGGDDEPTRSTTGVGVESLIREWAVRGLSEGYSNADLGRAIRRDGDLRVMTGFSVAKGVTDEELGREAYAALRAHQNRISKMRKRLGIMEHVVALHPFRNLLRTWDKYEDGLQRYPQYLNGEPAITKPSNDEQQVERRSAQELADAVAKLIGNNQAPAELADAVRTFVAASGGDSTAINAAVKQFELSVQTAAERIRTEIEQVMGTPNTIYKQASRTDSEYMAAVERGDMEAAQRMVDEAARAAGYTIKGYHGTGRKFSEFSAERMVWVSENAVHAGQYAGTRSIESGEQPIILPLFVRLNRPLTLSFKQEDMVTLKEVENATGLRIDMGPYFTAEVDGIQQRHKAWRIVHTSQFRDAAASAGYDGIAATEGKNTKTWAAFQRSQIKSADPVTRDESGNVIPLSRRFSGTDGGDLVKNSTAIWAGRRGLFMNWWKAAGVGEMNLCRRLEALRPLFAGAAQEVYDSWDQDDDGYAEGLGYGGICHLVADAIGEVLSERGIDTVNIHWDDANHVACVAYDDGGGCIVDVPCSLYENGGWYNWRKMKNVKFDGRDITISRISRGDVQGILDHGG